MCIRDSITDIPKHIIIIDAILGTGLNRAVEGWLADFINHINDVNNKKIAIDIPSGMPADNIPAKEAEILKADYTLSFQFYKRSFLHPETGKYAGNIEPVSYTHLDVYKRQVDTLPKLSL